MISVEAIVAVVLVTLHLTCSEKGRCFIRKCAFGVLRLYTGITPYHRMELGDTVIWYAECRDGSRLCHVLSRDETRFIEEYATGRLAALFLDGRANILRSTRR